MSRGIASALIEQANFFGRLHSNIGLFEVDEAYAEDVAQKVRPRTLVVLNLLRDQLDRYGELDRTAQLISRAFKYCQSIVLNADDRLVRGLAEAAEDNPIVYFGATVHLRRQLPDDASLLTKLRRGLNLLLEPHPRVEVLLKGSRLKDGVQQIKLQTAGKDYQANLQLSGLYNAYNAAAAVAALGTVGISPPQAVKNLDAIEPPFGRGESIEVNGHQIELILVKNPSGFNQVIQTFLLSEKKLPVLMALNDNFADGRDVSWIWDVDFEGLRVQDHQIMATGQRAYDLALRLKYAETKASVEQDLNKALKTFLKALRPADVGYIIPTYTAMLKLRSMLGQKAKVKRLWQ
jgi:UDP-N-acetylmuramyl tripeptide synthase